MPRYSAQFRNTVLKKLLPPEGRSALSLAREYNLSVGTIYGSLVSRDATCSRMHPWESQDARWYPANRKRRPRPRPLSSSQLKKNFSDVSGPKGRLIAEERRVILCETISDGIKQGARVAQLCEALGVHPRTYNRWKVDPADRRKGCRKRNTRALTEEEF